MHGRQCIRALVHLSAVAVIVFAVALSAHAQVLPECQISVDSTSPFLGTPYQPTWNLFNSKSTWATNGDITRIDLLFDSDKGCLIGLVPTYGNQGSHAKRLGLAAVGDKVIKPQQLQLEREEGINMVQIKYDSCITYLSLSTNKDRDISVGDVTSNGNLQILAPTSPAGYLAFMNVYTETDLETSDVSTGALEQLQLVWAVKDCASSPALGGNNDPQDTSTSRSNRMRQAAAASATAVTVSATAATATATTAAAEGEEVITEQIDDNGAVVIVAAPQPAATVGRGGSTGSPAKGHAATAAPASKPAAEALVYTAAMPVSSSPPTPAPKPASQALVYTATMPNPSAPLPKPSTPNPSTPPTSKAVPDGTCQTGPGCHNGICATSSCALNGLGKDVLPLSCFGTNLNPKPLLTHTIGDPCANLACKLDRPSCNSLGLLGVGGFCTGRVVAMDSAAELHSIGRSFVGYPCVESTGPLLHMLPGSLLGDKTKRETYVTKSWKVCDCIKGLEIHQDSLPDRPSLPNPSTPLRATAAPRPSFNMTMPKVIAEWVTAHFDNLTIPRIAINEQQWRGIKRSLPGLVVPSFVLPRVSAPLFKLPGSLGLPVMTIPSKAMSAFEGLLPKVTSLPAILVPDAFKGPLPPVHIPQVSVPNLLDLADTFNITLLPRLKPLPQLTFADAVTQWSAANRAILPLPKMQLTNETLLALSLLIPGFKVPSVVVPRISRPLLKIPTAFQLPIFELPSGRGLDAVAKLIPRLTSLPAVTLPEYTITIPQVSLPDVTNPNLEQIHTSLHDISRRWKALQNMLRAVDVTLPQLRGLNVTVPDFKIDLPGLKDTRLASGATSHIPSPKANISRFRMPSLPELPKPTRDSTPPATPSNSRFRMPLFPAQSSLDIASQQAGSVAANLRTANPDPTASTGAAASGWRQRSAPRLPGFGRLRLGRSAGSAADSDGPMVAATPPPPPPPPAAWSKVYVINSTKDGLAQQLVSKGSATSRAKMASALNATATVGTANKSPAAPVMPKTRTSANNHTTSTQATVAAGLTAHAATGNTTKVTIHFNNTGTFTGKPASHNAAATLPTPSNSNSISASSASKATDEFRFIPTARTAYMDPQDFYALDLARQEELLNHVKY